MSRLVAQLVKNLPAMGDTWVRSLGWEDLLEKGMATHSYILAWRFPWTGEPGRLHMSNGVPESDMTEQPTLSSSVFFVKFNEIQFINCLFHELYL